MTSPLSRGRRVVVSQLAEEPLEAVAAHMAIEPQEAPDPATLAAGDVIVAIRSAQVGWVDLVARGGGVGGGSAGLAIQGEHVYDACTGSVSSSEALANPFHRAISFTHDLFLWPNHDRIITDTHFTQRDRMGRLMAFVARHLQEGRASAMFGVGIDEGTAMVIDRLGQGRVFGAGTVSVVMGDHVPEVCAPKKRLTFSGFKIWKLVAGESYDFAQRPSSGFTLTDVLAGAIVGY